MKLFMFLWVSTTYGVNASEATIKLPPMSKGTYCAGLIRTLSRSSGNTNFTSKAPQDSTALALNALRAFRIEITKHQPRKHKGMTLKTVSVSDTLPQVPNKMMARMNGLLLQAKNIREQNGEKIIGLALEGSKEEILSFFKQWALQVQSAHRDFINSSKGQIYLNLGHTMMCALTSMCGLLLPVFFTSLGPPIAYGVPILAILAAFEATGINYLIEKHGFNRSALRTGLATISNQLDRIKEGGFLYHSWNTHLTHALADLASHPAAGWDPDVTLMRQELDAPLSTLPKNFLNKGAELFGFKDPPELQNHSRRGWAYVDQLLRRKEGGRYELIVFVRSFREKPKIPRRVPEKESEPLPQWFLEPQSVPIKRN